MFCPKKEVKYGYSRESSGDVARIITPPKLKKIHLTPVNTKFVIYGTRADILSWMLENEDMIVEYNSTDSGAFSPPSSPHLSPIPSPFLSATTNASTEILSSSPSSVLSTSSTKSNLSSSTNNLTFDLFGQPIRNSQILSDDLVFYRPLTFAMNYLPWMDMTLEIRPSDPVKDARYDPVRRVILKSGLTLGEISHALDKSWKNPLPDNINNYIRKSKSASTSDDEDELDAFESQQKYHKFLEWMPKSFMKQTLPIADSWYRKFETSPVPPPGVLTPYDIKIVDEVDASREKVMDSKKAEAEKDKEEEIGDLPNYENAFNDLLLERGSTVRRH
ncbi:954_t:CDS:2 [Acaulospora morrowiae]|uniref:954_t:CDS:1 n=1 Tax=Acaulospora morrowiae TaxID=94023 RepID=A0A9N8YZ30_9GLOM|nr:954_t:CDS:2 [Acaulospora morrowiae]